MTQRRHAVVHTLLALTALASAATMPVSGPASAEDEKRAETINGLVRIIGAQAGIVLYCRQFHAIDDKVSEGLSRTVGRALEATLGRQQARTAIDQEGWRVNAEIESVGAQQWCADQRDILNTEGVRVFVD